MTDFEAFAALQERGMSIVRSVTDVALFSKKLGTALLHLHDVYFVRKDATKKQRQAVEAATQNKHSLDTLIAIEQVVKTVEAKHRWNLRLELCRRQGTPEAIVAHGRARAAELNGPKTSTKRGATVRHGRNNISTLTLKDGRHNIAALVNATGGEDPETILDGLYDLAFNGGTAKPAIAPAAIIHLDDAIEILRGDDDIYLALTDGSIMSGKDFIEETMADEGFAVLVHPMEGPVDAHRIRFANRKQRLLASVVSPVCAWPGCTASADDSQVHHVEEYSKGGETNISNLAILCAYHNGVNGKPGRGRIVMVNHKPMWQPPWGGPPISNDHPALALAALR